MRSVEIRYADERFRVDSRQDIATPWELLHALKRGNCLDVSLIYAAACLDARLHPWLVVVESADQDAQHALVLVDLLADWPPNEIEWVERADRLVLDEPPAGLLEQVRSQPGAVMARWLPVDVATMLRRRGAEGQSGDFERAVERGREYLNEGWRWLSGVDIGRGFDPEQCHLNVEPPARSPIEAPYRETEQFSRWVERGDLRLFDPRRPLVPFVDRPEYGTLRDFFAEPAEADKSLLRVAVLYGPGGAGKTRLASELADDLSRCGWLTGFAREDSAIEQREWLSWTTANLLVVVDYAEASDVLSGSGRSLVAILGERPVGTRTCVLLTSRHHSDNFQATAEWWDTIRKSLTETPAATPMSVPLPARLSSHRSLFRRALRAFAGQGGASDRQWEVDPGWSALEIMLAAWAASRPDAPAARPSRSELYDTVIDHELEYWRRTLDTTFDLRVPIGLLREVAACIALTAPKTSRLRFLLESCTALRGQAVVERKLAVASAMDALLTEQAGGEHGKPELAQCSWRGPALGSDTSGLSIRPDRVAERLALDVFYADLQQDRTGSAGEDSEPLITRLLARTNDAERSTALMTIHRMAESDSVAAARLAQAVLATDPGRWREAFEIALQAGGPFASALERVATDSPDQLPMEQIANEIPQGHAYLRQLALLGHMAANRDEREYDDARRAKASLERAVRLADVGSRTEAVQVAREARDLYARLAEANPAAFLPNLVDVTCNWMRMLGGDLSLVNMGALMGGLAPGPAAELLVLCGARFADSGSRTTVSWGFLSLAIDLASREADPMWAARSRQVVRAVSSQLRLDPSSIAPDDPPAWLVATIDERTVAALEAWASEATWSRRAELILDQAGPVFNDAATLEALSQLHPDQRWLEALIALKQPFEEGSLRETLKGLVEQEAAVALLNGWFRTESWADSEEYLKRHRQELDSPTARRVLAELASNHTDEPSRITLEATRHLGILTLLDAGVAAADVYDMVEDRSTASDRAMNALRQADGGMLVAIVMAAPAVGVPGTLTGALLPLAFTWLLPGDGHETDDEAETPGGPRLTPEAIAETIRPDRAPIAISTLRHLIKARPDLAPRIEPYVAALVGASVEPVSE
ncbi:MAG: hypothetical protein LBC97_03785 [Bifidobacteriaceae bacterium]|nr:hypothetical protein [Bifidobacteriaceae bacterium]